MPRLTKIYTRKGDDGTTALGTKHRVHKDAERIQACGTVDELNSAIGLALAHGLSPRLEEELHKIQNDLFHLGASLSFPDNELKKNSVPRIEQRHIDVLEQQIDELSAEVGPLKNFILPGGSPGAAALHLARTICRRAERKVVAIRRLGQVAKEDVPYLNRLSDALFVMARYENKQRGVEDTLWDSRA